MLKNVKILVVEDERIVAEDIQCSLQSTGYQVSAVVTSGEEALRQVEKTKPDLVLMDIVLSGKMDGIDTAEEIVSRFDIPVIYLTAYFDEKTLEKAKLTKPYGYILKPYHESELQSSIQMALYKHQMEKEIREREAWFSTILTSIGEGIIATDNHGRIIFMNSIAEALTGWMQEKAVGKQLGKVFHIIHNETTKTIQLPLSRILKENLVYHLPNDVVLVLEDGKKVPIDDSVASIKDKRGQIIGAVLVFKDITKRIKVEEALRKSEDNFQHMVSHIEDILYRIDGQTQEFTYISPAFERVLGYTLEDINHHGGRKAFLSQIIQKGDFYEQDRILEGLKTKSNKKCSYHYEAWWRAKNGSVKCLEDHGIAVYRESRLESISGVLRDISERKHNEEALIKINEELKETHEKLIQKEKMAVLGQLASGVGHELRNPLGAIKNGVYFLKMVLDHVDPTVKETLDIFDKEINTSERIISNILQFARTKTPVQQQVHVSDIVRDTLSRIFVPDNIQVIDQMEKTLPSIMADPDQLFEIFENIVQNGVQAMPDGGQIKIHSGIKNPDCVAISFTDTGAGISDENLEKLFEPLFTTKAKGIGLGLAITKALVERHGGRIDVETEVGKGSTFRVIFPVHGVEK